MIKPKLSVIIPCYNEEKCLPFLIKRFKQVIKGKDIEVILVNNGSIDNSAEIMQKLQLKHNFLRTITIKKNIGYGHGITSGLKKAKGEFLAWTHADLQTDPDDIIKAFDIIQSKNNAKDYLVKGRRKNRFFFDTLLMLGMSFSANLILRKWMIDINAQPKLFHKSFFESWDNAPLDFSLDLYVYFMAKKKKKMKIITISTQFPKRIYGKSHWNTDIYSKFDLINKTVKYIIKLNKQS